MFRVVVKDGRGKVVESRKFVVEALAWEFFDQWDAEKFYLEFKDMNPFRQ